MALRLRRDRADVEEGGAADEKSDVATRSLELETLVSSLRAMLDHSRRREKKLVQMLHEAGVEHHIDMEGDSGLYMELSFWRGLLDRAMWLIGLLIFQSLSSYILSSNEGILQRHPNIVYFLTMLVGAGGNAGNQATVRAIRGLAVGSLARSNLSTFLRKELFMSLALCVIVGAFGFVRVYVFSAVTLRESVAITLSLMAIVMSSVLVGSALPLAFFLAGVDPANSSTTIQVVMDISGVLITCVVAGLMLDQVATSA